MRKDEKVFVEISSNETKNEILFHFQNGECFNYSPTEESITAYQETFLDDSTINHLFLDHCLPYVLSSLGNLVLHSSLVKKGNRLIAFVGPSGSGKSSVAALLLKNNFKILADDFWIFTNTGKIIPGYASLRLWNHNSSILSSDSIKKELPINSIPGKSSFLLKNNTQEQFTLKTHRLEILHLNQLQATKSDSETHTEKKTETKKITLRSLPLPDRLKVLMSSAFIMGNALNKESHQTLFTLSSQLLKKVSFCQASYFWHEDFQESLVSSLELGEKG